MGAWCVAAAWGAQSSPQDWLLCWGPPGVLGEATDRTPGQPEGAWSLTNAGVSWCQYSPRDPYMNRVESALGGVQASLLAEGPGHL